MAAMAGARTNGEPDAQSAGGLWRRASEVPQHPVARWDGAAIGDDLELEAWLGPRNSVGAHYFRLWLRSNDLGRLREPVIFGMQNSGRYPGYNWVEVIGYRDQLTAEDGQSAGIPVGVERLIFRELAELVPPGGHLMAEYDSPARRITARALAAGVPARATPLGAALAAAGCGVALRDWYIPEGGREGPRKLQGFRAVDAQHEREREAQTLEALHAFLLVAAQVEWDVQARTRPLALAAIEELEARANARE